LISLIVFQKSHQNDGLSKRGTHEADQLVDWMSACRRLLSNFDSFQVVDGSREKPHPATGLPPVHSAGVPFRTVPVPSPQPRFEQTLSPLENFTLMSWPPREPSFIGRLPTSTSSPTLKASFD
jgi:hypothetical protein